ncbi:MAG: START domain-containing protein [Bacteroidota bacterium]
MKSSFKRLLLGGMILFSSFLLSAQNWQLEKDERSIQVYTLVRPGEPLKAFRAVTQVQATPEQVLAIITNADQGHQWMDRCVESKLLKRLSDQSYLTYTRIETPWPLEDRDLVVEMTIHQEGDKIICSMRNAPDAYPAQESVIRMPKYEGSWTLIPLPEGGTQVISEGKTSPGGSIPDWLANTEVVDSPYTTLANLRKRLDG